MFKESNLQFYSRSILTKEMLEELYGYTHDFIDIKYAAYPDGIIEGCGFESIEGEVWLMPGIIKANNRIFRMAKPENITALVEQQALKSGGNYILGLIPCEWLDNNANTGKRLAFKGCHSLRLAIYEAAAGSSEESFFLLAKFKLLRDKLEINTSAFWAEEGTGYSSFWDLRSIPYSIKDGVTFHTDIFKEIKQQILKNGQANALRYWELFLLEQLMQQGKVSKEFLRALLKLLFGAAEKLQADDNLLMGLKKALLDKTIGATLQLGNGVPSGSGKPTNVKRGNQEPRRL